MKTEKLDYHLPAELIAQQPCGVRSDSRLLCLNGSSGKIIDSRFCRLKEFLLPGDCLVLLALTQRDDVLALIRDFVAEN